jgi:hypothetical protein
MLVHSRIEQRQKLFVLCGRPRSSGWAWAWLHLAFTLSSSTRRLRRQTSFVVGATRSRSFEPDARLLFRYDTNASRSQQYSRLIPPRLAVDRLPRASRPGLPRLLAFRFQPQLDQAADGLGAAHVARSGPGLDLTQRWQPHRHGRIAPSGRSADLFLLVYLN